MRGIHGSSCGGASHPTGLHGLWILCDGRCSSGAQQWVLHCGPLARRDVATRRSRFHLAHGDVQVHSFAMRLAMFLLIGVLSLMRCPTTTGSTRPGSIRQQRQTWQLSRSEWQRDLRSKPWVRGARAPEAPFVRVAPGTRPPGSPSYPFQAVCPSCDAYCNIPCPFRRCELCMAAVTDVC